MKILLFGKDGQVGWELQRSLSVLGDLVAVGRGGPPAGDLSRLEDLAATVRLVRPDVIVNAAAYTAVDRAESEPDLARLINAAAPGRMANVAAEIGCLLVHYSTDYVFDGSGDRPWHEDDLTGPLSHYGLTKLEGERAIKSTGCRHLIFRTSWVYGIRGANFAKTILRLLQEREVLTIIDDQFGSPTSAEMIADLSAHAIRTAMADQTISGTFHLTASGETNWFDYAVYLSTNAQRLVPDRPWLAREINPIATADFRSAAVRPLNSRLDTKKFRETFNARPAHWRHGVDRFLAETLRI